MSGEPKTHTPQAMTLGEALAAVRAKAKADGPAYMVTEVRFMPFAHYPWWVEMAYGDVKVYADWPPALSFALGVPVVARDEAAELREENRTLRTEADGWLKRVELLEAAIREWAEATSDAEMFELDQSNAYGTDHADAEDRVEAAAQALRRLAGGESEQ